MHIHFMHSLKAVLLLLVVTCTQAHVFEDEGLLGDKKQIKLEPKYSGANLIGLDVYELWVDEVVGHSFLSKRSYYRFDAQRVTEDREWYHVNGLLGDLAIEVENRYETQHWSITIELAASLDRAARLVANPKASSAELKAMYRGLSRSAFTVKAGQLEREGQKQAKWIPGLQKIDQAEFMLSKSLKFGNRFNARFTN